MPYFDGTGPMGQGQMTGKGMGSCGSGYGLGRRLFRKGRRGFLGCFGRGYSRGWRFFQPDYKLSKVDLEEYKKSLQDELEEVEEELKKTE